MQHQPKQRRRHPLPTKTRRIRQSPCAEGEVEAPAKQKGPVRRSQRRSNRLDEVVAPRKRPGEVAVLQKRPVAAPLADTSDLLRQHSTVARAQQRHNMAAVQGQQLQAWVRQKGSAPRN